MRGCQAVDPPSSEWEPVEKLDPATSIAEWQERIKQFYLTREGMDRSRLRCYCHDAGAILALRIQDCIFEWSGVST